MSQNNNEAILLRLYFETKVNSNKLERLNNEIEKLELQRKLHKEYEKFCLLIQKTMLLLQNPIPEKEEERKDLLRNLRQLLLTATESHNNEIRQLCTLV